MKCIIEGCEREAKTRGLCKQCYTSASNAIKRGRVPSWEFLEDAKLALPAAGQAKSPFTQALEEKLHTVSHQKASEVQHGGNQ